MDRQWAFRQVIQRLDILVEEYASKDYEMHFKLSDGSMFMAIPRMKVCKVSKVKRSDCPAVAMLQKNQTQNVELSENFNSLRFEYNPNNGYPHALETLLSTLLEVFKERITLKNVKINRIDVAVDYHERLRPEKFYTDRIKKGRNFFDVNAGTETYYLGQRRSQKSFRIYNKQIEMWEKKKVKVPHDWFRVEAEITPHKGFLHRQDIPDPFKNLHYHMEQEMNVSELKPEEKFVINLLLDSVDNDKSRTIDSVLDNALRGQETNQQKFRVKKKIKRLLEQCSEANEFVSPSEHFKRSGNIIIESFWQDFEKLFGVAK